MADVTCAISGVRFRCSHFDSLSVPHTEGFIHPIFAVPYKHLFPIYTKHCKGLLPPTDSYLLFLAFLYSSNHVNFLYPATCNPNDKRVKVLIENNISQLVEVLEKSATIKYPSFTQPKFKVTQDNATLLHQIPHWIKAWKANIESFYAGRVSAKVIEDLQETENRLSRLILSAEKPQLYAHVIAAVSYTHLTLPTKRIV